MAEFKEFVADLKKIFNVFDSSKSKLYEATYSKLIGIEEHMAVEVNKDTLTVDLKKYKFSSPDKTPIIFYRVIAQFQKNIYYNSFLKLSFDDAISAGKFYTKISGHIEKSMPLTP